MCRQDRRLMRPAGSTLGVRPAGSRPEEVQSTLGLRRADRRVYSPNPASYVVYRTVRGKPIRHDESPWLNTFTRRRRLPGFVPRNAFTALSRMSV